MSVILIRQHNECIYNVTKPPDIITEPKMIPKKPKPTQKFGEGVNKMRLAREKRRLDLTQKKAFTSMGLPKQPPEDPQNFLKKKTGKPPFEKANILQARYGTAKLDCKQRKSPIPHREETLKETEEKLKHVKKDFIALNIENAIKQQPKTPMQQIVINNKGDTRELIKGLEPQYLQTNVFGKIPEYLDHLIRIHKRHMQALKDKSGTMEPPCKYITRDKREKLLAGLKENWEELQRLYQGLPILTDTIPKINRKSKLENDLKQLEKDIVLIERHPYIYVYEDENDFEKTR